MSESIRIMVVEDNDEDLKLVKNYLTPKGYTVVEARSGEAAIEVFKSQRPHLVILDYVLPDIEGPEICRRIKSIHPEAAVLILSAQRTVQFKVLAFKAGCDDYMIKPCELEEMEVRMQNLLKRAEKESVKILKIGDIEIDTGARQVMKGGKTVDLTVKEYALLEYLVKSANKILTRNMILESVWGEDSGSFTNIVDVYVNYLRKKLDKQPEKSFIKTVRGIGYMVERPEAVMKAA